MSVSLRVRLGASAFSLAVLAATATAETAVYDHRLLVPSCDAVAHECDSGALLVGRGPLGAEPNAPNTLGAVCSDGTAGYFHRDESLDRLRISTLDGEPFTPGKTVRVEATAWVFGAGEVLDIYSAPDAEAESPSWQMVATMTPTATGEQVLGGTFDLPTGDRQAIRGVLRGEDASGPCAAGATSDHDDLVFAVGTAVYSAELLTPVCPTIGAPCDTGTLLTGGANQAGQREPHGPNTTVDPSLGFSSCPDNPGTLDGFISAIRLDSTDGGPIVIGAPVNVDVLVLGSSYASERLDLYELIQHPSGPESIYIGSATPTASQLRTLSFTYTPTAATAETGLRAVLRSASRPPTSGCEWTSGADHDDVWFWREAPAGEHALVVDVDASLAWGSELYYGQPLAIPWGGSVQFLDSTGTPISCEAQAPTNGHCSAQFPEGTVVTLEASPDNVSDFVGWSGACAGLEPVCEVTLTEARRVTARFGPPETLTLGVDGRDAGTGTVESFLNEQAVGDCDNLPPNDPPDCTGNSPQTCILSLPRDALVTIAATPTPGSAFVGWSGGCTGSGQVCSLTLDESKSVRALFDSSSDPNLPMATFDATLEVPACRQVGTACDSGELLTGRGSACVGCVPEPHAPNTLGGTCQDGTYPVPNAVNRVRVFSLDGGPLVAGATAGVDVTLEPGSLGTLEIYSASNALAPVWTKVWSRSGIAWDSYPTHSTDLVLPSGSLQAVRAVLRNGSPSPTEPACYLGSSADHDDLVFAVAGNATFAPARGTPTCLTNEASCDTGNLLVGRGDAGPEPHAPNTTIGGAAQCADDDGGSLHVDRSIERLRVFSALGTPMAVGQPLGIAATIWASEDYASDRLDLYVGEDGANDWTFLTSIAPTAPGLQVLSVTYTPEGPSLLRGVRAVVHSAVDAPSSCGGTWPVDQDDLWFQLQWAESSPPPSVAVDPVLGTPACAFVAASCDTGDLVSGRGDAGPEPSAPNTTIDRISSQRCQDDNGGTPWVDRSIENIRVESVEGGPLAIGQPATVHVRVWASGNYASERLDIFAGRDGQNDWSLLGSLFPSSPGLQDLSLPYAPEGPSLLQGVRAVFRASADALAPCGGSWPTDHDDLWFRVDAAPGSHTLVIDVEQEDGGTGTVVGSEGSCSTPEAGRFGVCSSTHDEGAVVHLRAVASPTSEFVGWSGACWGTRAICDVVMDAARLVRARFRRVRSALAVTVERVNGGMGAVVANVADSPAWSCESTLDEGASQCATLYDLGASVTLAANAAPSSVFLGWDGACAGVGAPTCELTMGSSQAVVARFGPIPLLSIEGVTIEEGDSGTRALTIRVNIEEGTAP